MVIQIPDGLTPFTLPDGREFKLDIIEAHERINEISKACREAGLTNFEYVGQFKAWIFEKTSIDLNKAQADYVIDRILTTYADEKKAVSASLNSVSSTAQPSAS